MSEYTNDPPPAYTQEPMAHETTVENAEHNPNLLTIDIGESLDRSRSRSNSSRMSPSSPNRRSTSMTPPIDLHQRYSWTPAADPLSLPTCDDLRAHCKLMELFHGLRKRVENTPGLFGLEERRTETGGSPVVGLGNGTFSLEQDDFRQKKWAVYVSRAVWRFDQWWKVAVINHQGDKSAVTYQDLKTRGRTQNLAQMPAGSEECFLLSTRLLPPLDVLMVWHAYMMSPRQYLEDCMRNGDGGWFLPGFPLRLIIDEMVEYGQYWPGNAAWEFFTQQTGCKWSNLHDPAEALINCCECNMLMRVDWVVPFDLGLSVEDTSVGFSEQGFRASCPQCRAPNTHDTLALARFKRHLRYSVEFNCPLRGTISPNSECSLLLREFAKHNMTRILACRSMKEIRRLIASDYYEFHPMYLPKIHQIMDMYVDNHGIYSVELCGAVVRQSAYIDQVARLSWFENYHLEKFITKYIRMFEIIKEEGLATRVTTLDCDLVWHTHLLQGFNYLHYSMEKTNRHVGHDEPIEETQLSLHFEDICKRYYKRFNEPFMECHCWYCQCISANVHTTGLMSRLSKPSLSSLKHQQQQQQQAQFGIPSELHVSNHSAAHTPGNVYGLRYSKTDHYTHLTKRFRRGSIQKGDSIKSRMEHSLNDFFAQEGPFMKPDYVPEMYPFDPSRLFMVSTER